jgi:hypothetical protein
MKKNNNNLSQITYLGYGNDLINSELSQNYITNEDIPYLTNLLKKSSDSVDDFFNIILKAYKLTPYMDSKNKITYKNNKNKKVKAKEIIENAINLLKVQEIESLIKKENSNLIQKTYMQIESTDFIFLDMEQAEQLLNINIIENDEEKMDFYYSNENYIDMDEAKESILKNLKERFGLNISNVAVVNNQFIIENKQFNFPALTDTKLINKLQMSYESKKSKIKL